jgi:endonuclease YncB( thermonuclease family)
MARGSIVMMKAILLLLLFCSLAHADIAGRVVAVTDGDTIKVLDADNTEYKVRLTGVDAPERGQPYNDASRKHLASMVAGKEVLVEIDKQDIYGRELGKVWVQPSDCPTCGKTLNANYAQVLAGMAWWYRYYAKEQSPEDRGRYESAEDEAKVRKWGLWADPNPINSYDWRKRKWSRLNEALLPVPFSRRVRFSWRYSNE